ncbi:MAG: hypothetical protein KA974_03895 [Saprospiraceae bacterium]|nr:hypothetical protein [Saprospiraceae bacterium]MBP7679901.1 hypothetical protein [Saprospiraceae bacterium]
MAIFTLPPEMIVFYKNNMEFLTEHAVDPDKRRYATKHEAVRHYMDLDKYGTPPYDNLPRTWTEALMKFTQLFIVNNKNDTIVLLGGAASLYDVANKTINSKNVPNFVIDQREYHRFYTDNILPQYYEDAMIVSCDSIRALMNRQGVILNCTSAFVIDTFSQHGILPYNLQMYQRKLTDAFRNKDAKRILQFSADIGHYIGDGHVPLHTTSNYNGQLTNQNGIHGFWESRIPELFADDTYDFFVGKAEYFDNPNDYYWNIVLTSHTYVDSVLLIEKSLSETFPPDKQFCFDERLEQTVRTQCREYAAAYQKRLAGQVEQRMREAIRAVGSAWYTAWVDAGQPDLSNLSILPLTDAEKKEREDEEASFRKGVIKGRAHEN